MKKGILSIVLSLICMMAFAQQTTPQWTRVLSDRPETFRTQLVSSTENSVKVNIQVPGFYTTNVTTPRGEAKIVSMPKTVSTAKAGEPNLPMTGIPAIIGDKARMDIRVIDAQYMDFEGIEVAPSKGDFSRQIDPATVPYTYGECYSQDAFFPANNVGLYEPYIVRDFRGQNMVIYPYAYNPVSKTLRVYYNMTVEMYKEDDSGTNVFETRRSNTIKMCSDFKSMYQRHFINYDAASAKYTPLDEEGDLLIICYDSFISSMTEFVNWKKTRGVNTTIVGTSTISSSLTYSNLKTYIQNQYNANNNLTHVLLVGDAAQIPGYTYSGGGSSWSGKGDNPYGQIVGSDIYNDVFIGRFSAGSAAQVTTQVNRIITYERDLTTSATWCQNGLGISASAGSGGHYNEDDYEHVENLRTDLLNYGYNTVYQDYASVSGYPSSSTTTISNHINSGVGVINYCNHGEETGWQSHYYMNSNVNALTNDNKLPFIFSVACLVGKYDYSSGDCFAETWMHATNGSNPTGAVSGMFSYISQPWIPPMWAQDEFVDILVESYNNNIKRSFGGAAMNGLFSIFDNYSTSSTEAVGCYQAWVLYGDPTLMMRTKTPQAMTVTHSGSLPLGSASYSVSVSNGNGAVATITDANHNILGKATVSNGTATISLNSGSLTSGAQLTLCVFGYNKVTYLGTITVIATGEQYTISANVNPTAAGSVSGAGTYYENSNCTLTATANTGYGFTNWTKNGSQVSTNPSYTFTVTSNATYTANFHQLEQHQIAYTAQQSHGSISVSPTDAYAGDVVTLTATPDPGYTLDHWTVTTGRETIPVENNQFVMPDSEVTVSATFKSEPLTVANGTGTNDEIPFFGLYADDNYQHTQTIYPSSMLTNMQGCQITKLTYYLSSSVSKSFGSTFQVRFGTTNSTAFSTGTVNYISITDAAVYSGTLTVSGTTVEFDFSDNPYLYSGGNLVIDVRITALGSGYTSMSFYGESESTYYSVKSKSTSSLPTTSGSSVSFMPKTTFTFTAPTSDPYIILAPNSTTILTGLTQTLAATYGNVSGTPSITYTSSNNNVATVSGSGTTATVTAVAPGTATITATMTYEGTPYTATCAVTVEEASYCEPSFSNPSDDYISKFATTGGTTNINNTSTYVSGGYSDYYSTQSASINVGETLSCTVTASSTQWSYGHAIWVDWNKDYEFTSDERVAYTTSTATGNWTGSFAVPADANGGDYRMRVIHYYNQASPSDPCVSAQYGEAEDYKLTVIASGTQYTIAATANPTAGGTVTGAGQYYENSQCTLNATPNANYAFASWTKNGVVVSTSASYSFTVTENASYVANFNYMNTVTIKPNDPEFGIVAFGRNRETLTYDFEDGWQGWTAVQGTDGTSPHNWMHNTEYTAYSGNGNIIDLTTSGYNSSGGFMLSESYISAATSGGTATGAIYPDNYLISPQIRLGGSITFYAAGRTTDCYEKFTVMVSTTGTNISDFTNTSFTVTLDSQTYTQYTVDLSEYNGMGYVVFHHYDCTDQHMLKIDNITIVEGEVNDGSITASYANGTSCTVIATPNTGYHFVNWTENGTSVSTNASYTFTVTGNRELVANFSQQVQTYTITATANPTAGGTVTGAGTYNQGSTATLTATANTGYTFTNWKKGNTVVSTNPTYTFTVTESAAYVANFEQNTESQMVTLPIGWSWWSTYVEITLNDLKSALGTDGASIVSQDGMLSYMDDYGWDGDIFSLELSQMYEINMNGTAEVTVSAVVADPADYPVTLNHGYTWIGYPVQQSMNVSNALSGLNAVTGDFIKSKSGMAMYTGSNWVGTLNSMVPGQGYMYYSNANNAKTFTYPSSRGGEVRANVTDADNYWKSESSRFANNMNVMAVVELDGTEALNESIEVGAFVGDECRGSVRLMRVEETGRYMAFLTIHGETGESVSFRLFNGTEEREVSEIMELRVNALVGDLATPYVLHTNSDLTLFPNPVMKGEAFTMEMPSGSALNGARVEVFNALGSLVRTEVMNGSDAKMTGMPTAGVYTVKVTDQKGNVHFTKLVVR